MLAAPVASTAPPAPLTDDDSAARERVLAASAALDGWLGREEAEALYDLAAGGTAEGAVVEVGSFVGKSLVCLAGGALRRGGGPVVSIDHHAGSPEHQPGGASFTPAYWSAAEGRVDTLPALRGNLQAAGVADGVELRVGASYAAAAAWDGPIRLLFLDGGHDYAQIARDLRGWTRWVMQGGVVAFHDYEGPAWPGVSQAVDEWLSSSPDFRPVRVAGSVLVVERRAPAPAPAADAGVGAEWARAAGGDGDAGARWSADGGRWSWEGGALRVQGDGGEWASCAWGALGPAALAAVGGYAVEVTVSGRAEAAGLSLGPYRDLLARLEPDSGPRRLRLEVHPDGPWSFTVDGRPQLRAWWDEALDQPGRGALTLKARHAEDVRFQDLVVQPLPPAPCRLSVVVTCSRFAQRLRVSLRGWCAQALPTGGWEVLVVNPESPDGTREQVAAAAHANPRLRVREVAVPASLALNKGAMVNQGIDAARGEWIWLADADCLFSPTAGARVLEWMREDRLGFCERRHLSAGPTRGLLAGGADPAADWPSLVRSHGPHRSYRDPWGYCQVVHRTVAGRVRYGAETNHFADTDREFVHACQAVGVVAERVPGLLCLHLEHPFAWYGTSDFL